MQENEQFDVYEEIECNQEEYYYEPSSMDLLMSELKEIKIYYREDNSVKLKEYNEVKNKIKLLEQKEQTVETKSLITKLKETLKNIKSEIVIHNTAFVINIAKKYQSKKIPLEDLIQEGCLGLMKAIDNFDPSMEFSFSTYAYYWIKQCVMRAKYNTQETIRISVPTCQLIFKMNKYIEKYQTIHGVEPTDQELMKVLGLNNQQVIEVKKANYINSSLVSLDRPFGDESDTTFMDIITDEENKYECIENKDRDEFVKNLIDVAIYDKRVAYIIKNRVGYNEENKVKTLEEIGAELDVTRERIRQLELTGIKRIKAYCKKRNITINHFV